jgi:K+-sensing histidine kinase KdpD
MAAQSSPAPGETIQWDNFVKFVRQLSHDLRNQLNATELQAALINELTADPELKPEVARLRELVGKLGTSLQQLSVAVAPPRLTRLPYSANDLLTDLQKNVAREFPEQAQRVKWEFSSNGAILDIDPTLIGWAMTELFANAFRHGVHNEIAARGGKENGQFIFALREPKSAEVAPAKWRDLLSAAEHGHYGLGLRRARVIVAAHGGELTSEWDAQNSTLTSRIILPCSTEST